MPFMGGALSVLHTGEQGRIHCWRGMLASSFSAWSTDNLCSRSINLRWICHLFATVEKERETRSGVRFGKRPPFAASGLGGKMKGQADTNPKALQKAAEWPIRKEATGQIRPPAQKLRGSSARNAVHTSAQRI